MGAPSDPVDLQASGAQSRPADPHAPPESLPARSGEPVDPHASGERATAQSGPSGSPAAPAPRPPGTASNPWSDATREILVRQCGKCHRGDLPTAIPGALAVFDLMEDPWYGRLTDPQLDALLKRIRGIEDLMPDDQDSVARFVACEREGACQAGAVAGP